MSAIRIGVVGARRKSQGIGHYVAGHLSKLGADVRGIVGTSETSIESAQQSLLRDFDLSVRGFSDLVTMIEAEQLEAVAVCSPYATHRSLLQTALEHNQHVLCEKPLVFDPSRDDVADVRELVSGFAEQDRLLVVNQQWPYVLPAFESCYPEANITELKRLEMLMGPSELGIAMIPNALPHVVSLLLAHAPAGGRLNGLTFDQPGEDALDVRFDYVHARGAVEVLALLRQMASQPRPAGIAINGCTVARRIILPSYQMMLEAVNIGLDDVARQEAQVVSDAAKCVPLEDPLRLLLADFIRRVSFRDTSRRDDPILIENVRLVQEIYQAAKAVFTP